MPPDEPLDDDFDLERTLDALDWFELELVPTQLHRSLHETVWLCGLTLVLCVSMIVFVPDLSTKLIFAIIGYAAVLVGVVQAALGLSKIIEINACLRAWKGAPCAERIGSPATPNA